MADNMAENKELKASTEAKRQKKADRRDAKAARKEANKVEEMRKKADKERIAELEQENEELTACILELAEIIGGGE